MSNTAGLKIFTTEDFAYRNVITKAGTYTVLAADELVQVNGTYTMTLPPLNSLAALLTKKKAYKFKNIHATATATIQPGTNTITGVADTINGKALFSLMPNESIIITGTETGTDWTIQSPYPQPAMTRVPFNWVASTSGTTAVNIFDANGAPANIDITAIITIATVTLAGTATVLNGTDTVLALAKSTSIGGLSGGIPSGAAAVAKGSVCTVAMGAASEDCYVIILGTAQVYA